MRNSTLSPGKPLARGTPLRRKSARVRRQARARQACVAEVRGRVWCEYPGCSGRGTDVHEVKPRSAGGSVEDPSNCRLLCQVHHRRVHEFPREAFALGLKVSRYPGGGA